MDRSVTHEVLRRVPYRAFSLTEDLEYGIDLGLAGFRVAYADEADANADMVSGAQAAAKQRERWEAGRYQLTRSKTLPLLRAALADRSKICLDLAMDLVVPPLSYVVLNILALLAVAGIAYGWHLAPPAFLWLGMGCAGCVIIYVARGWQLSGIGARGLLDLAAAPGYLVWKVIVMLKRRRSDEWIRTERENPPVGRTPKDS